MTMTDSDAVLDELVLDAVTAALQNVYAAIEIVDRTGRPGEGPLRAACSDLQDAQEQLMERLSAYRSAS